MRRISIQEWENEHMHSPMTEGEALAVDAVAKAIADVVGHGMSEKCEAQARAAIAALTAHTAASAGEPYAYMEDCSLPGVTSLKSQGKPAWFKCLTVKDELHTFPLYTRPPAAVPADALERLVVEWRDQAKRLRNEVPNLRDGTDKRFDSARDADRAADELAALIPKGADHA